MQKMELEFVVRVCQTDTAAEMIALKQLVEFCLQRTLVKQGPGFVGMWKNCEKTIVQPILASCCWV